MKRTCEDCGKEFDFEKLEWGGKVVEPKHCDECCEKREREEEAAQRIAVRNEQWLAVCPPLYRETDLARLPKKYREAISKWAFGPFGLGFMGEPGSGKTRACFQILKKQIEEGREVRAISATRFGQICTVQFAQDDAKREEAEVVMEGIRECDVLLFDDIGKGKMTERAELELYDLLEIRTSYLRPTLWTANSSPDALLSAMSSERGGAIMRRLAEFSEII